MMMMRSWVWVALVLSGAWISWGLDERQSRFNECQLDRINALEPDYRIESEAGLTETWNANHRELRCAGVTIIRRTIHRHGLHLPSYSPATQLHFIAQGKGLLGITVNPGCPPNYEEEQSEGQTERHQKIRDIREGDVIAIPSGVPYWTYNNGESPLVAITLLDTSNQQNQLDRNPRRFYLAGNPEEEHPETQEQRDERRKHRKHPRQEEQQDNEGNNVLSGFDTEFLAEALRIDEETARKLQAPRDRRNAIVRVPEGLSIMSPQSSQDEEQEQEDEPRRRPRQQSQEGEEEEEREPRRQSERERRRQGQQGQQGQSESKNALVTTLCSLRLKQNIANPQRADLYNPRAGRITTLNSLDLSILRPLRLSAEWVVLYRNGIYGPHYTINANSILYATRGSARIQIVNYQGKAVFDGQLNKGQLLVVPQGFVVAKQARDEGFECIVFKTNDRAMISPLVGRTSVLNGIPVQVLANAFGINLQQATAVKYARNEGILISPSSSRSRDSLIKL